MARSDVYANPTRHLDRYEVDPNSGCWLWSGATGTDGYGRLKVLNLYVRAHRYFYEQLIGPIPPGSVVCHRCDTPLCVNPAHLFAGSMLENTKDARNKGRLCGPRSPARGQKQHCARLTEDAVRLIRSDDRNARILAAALGVSRGAIIAVRSRRTWRWVQP